MKMSDNVAEGILNLDVWNNRENDSNVHVVDHKSSNCKDEQS